MTRVPQVTKDHLVNDDVTLQEPSIEHILSSLDEDMFVNDSSRTTLQLLSQNASSLRRVDLSARFALPFNGVAELDAEGALFLQCYREKYCSFVSIAPEKLNYFLKTFFSLAMQKQSILYALTAWGGFFSELIKPERNFSKPWFYMQKAAKLICEEIGSNLEPSNKEEFFTLFAFYLIFIGIEVCTGDVKVWIEFHRRCFRLINSVGGLLCVAEQFGHSNNIKWLISDFQFHDVLSSNALTGGTHFSIAEYEEILHDDNEYGIDPLQGTITPIYNILGEIANAKVELLKMLDRINELEDSGQEAYVERAQYYEELERVWAELNAKIDQCSPWPSHMRMLAHDQNQLSLHMALFELYTYVCRIQLGTSILRLAPSSIAQQRLLLKALVLVDLLLDTPLNVSLSLLLLVCGVTCWRTYDRARMRFRFEHQQNQYEIGNSRRIQEVVEGVWLENPNGDVCIDWAEFANRNGWSLYTG